MSVYIVGNHRGGRQIFWHSGSLFLKNGFVGAEHESNRKKPGYDSIYNLKCREANVDESIIY